MRAFEFLIEKSPTAELPAAEAQDSPDIEALKLALSSKIKELPTDPATMKLLHQVEDLLSNVGAGSRAEYVGSQLQAIQDPDVNKAQKLISKYFISLDASPKDKQEMLNLWKADNLVNVDLLLTPGKNTISKLINGYDKNPAIKEMTDDLSQISALGQGKGEFLLSVFSKKITKAGKGDLAIDGVGSVEVKTTDVGAARFYDRQVRPTSKYQGAVNDFNATFKEELAAQKLTTTTGISLTGLIKLYSSLDVTKRDTFKSSISSIISNIFPSAQDSVQPIVDSILAGNENQAKQRYAVAALNNYMEQKDDVGILAINLKKEPYTFVFFTDNKSLNAGGMRLHASTAYPITNDPLNAYPQTNIVDTAQAQG